MSHDDEFEDFVAHEGPALYRYACLLTGNAALAQDLAQEAVVRLYENRRRVERAAWSSYARRSVHNLNVSWWRKIVRREEELDHTRHDAHLPDGATLLAERDEVARAVRSLPPRTRSAIVLFYFEDQPTRQIAEILDCSEPSVRAMLSRGRAALRDRLAPTREEVAR